MRIKSRLYPESTAAIDWIGQRFGPNDQAVGLIPAAGIGSRSGLGLPKQYYRLGGVTVLARSIRALAGLPALSFILVVLSPNDEHWLREGLDQELGVGENIAERVIAVPMGGPTRRDSVMAGCELVRKAVSGDRNPWIVVHDAARPGLSSESVMRLWSEVSACGHGGILAQPIADTVKRSGDQGGDQPRPYGSALVESTIDRRALWAAQTPQMFYLNELLAAYAETPTATDEASAIESVGGSVLLVKGNALNSKLTQPEDFQFMEAVMAHSPNPNRNPPVFAVGQGFDVHALVVGRPLIIGGVTIPFAKGLDGHSDADVLLHAITDAILGAASMGDIGRHFPDNDPQYKGADSRVLLQQVIERVTQAGWAVSQIDATIIAQAPKIAPYASQMVEVIAACCATAQERVNVKGKTTEGLGFTGRGEGIAAQAIATLVRQV